MHGLLAIVLLALGLAAADARAQIIEVGSSVPVVLRADNVAYDSRQGIVIATGKRDDLLCQVRCAQERHLCDREESRRFTAGRTPQQLDHVDQCDQPDQDQQHERDTAQEMPSNICRQGE